VIIIQKIAKIIKNKVNSIRCNKQLPPLPLKEVSRLRKLEISVLQYKMEITRKLSKHLLLCSNSDQDIKLTLKKWFQFHKQAKPLRTSRRISWLFNTKKFFLKMLILTMMRHINSSKKRFNKRKFKNSK